MTTENTNRAPAILAGVAACIYMLLRIIRIIPAMSEGYFSGWGWFYLLADLAAVILIAYSAFANQKGVLMPIGFGIFAISWLVSLMHYFSFYELLYVLAYALAAFVLLCLLTDMIPSAKELFRKLWFIPGIILLAALIIELAVGGLFEDFFWNLRLNIVGILQMLVIIAATFFACWWASAEASPERAASAGSRAVPAEGEGYCSLVRHILLLLFTFGVWYFIWIYRTTRYLNRTPDLPERNPTTELLLCMFIPFYSIYWVYKSAQRIDVLGQGVPGQSEIATLCLILAIFVGFVAPIIMQDKLNNIVLASQAKETSADSWTPSSYDATLGADESVPQREEEVDLSQAAETISRYKRLLEEGAISQEEYDSLKKRVLHL